MLKKFILLFYMIISSYYYLIIEFCTYYILFQIMRKKMPQLFMFIVYLLINGKFINLKWKKVDQYFVKIVDPLANNWFSCQVQNCIFWVLFIILIKRFVILADFIVIFLYSLEKQQLKWKCIKYFDCFISEKFKFPTNDFKINENNVQNFVFYSTLTYISYII